MPVVVTSVESVKLPLSTEYQYPETVKVPSVDCTESPKEVMVIVRSVE